MYKKEKIKELCSSRAFDFSIIPEIRKHVGDVSVEIFLKYESIRSNIPDKFIDVYTRANIEDENPILKYFPQWPAGLSDLGFNTDNIYIFTDVLKFGEANQPNCDLVYTLKSLEGLRLFKYLGPIKPEDAMNIFVELCGFNIIEPKKEKTEAMKIASNPNVWNGC